MVQHIESKFQFEVNIEGLPAMRFQSLDGLRKSVAVSEYREGGTPTYIEKFSGLATYDPVTLRRGIVAHDSINEEIDNWIKMVDDPTSFGTPLDYKKSITIIEYSKDGTIIREVRLYNAWISSVIPGSWDATSSDRQLLELEITFDYFEQIWR